MLLTTRHFYLRKHILIFRGGVYSKDRTFWVAFGESSHGYIDLVYKIQK